ncbi:MAG TPA: MerR family transcriptional regulator [Actinomycetota bacterium]|nr:MerR family transcriptional regulator [Actinomycetota bacterium]
MRLRVDELAGRAGVSVDTVRFYQSKGLLQQPEREGRVAWYGDDHLERLERIRDLKGKGFTLGSIKRFLARELDPADEALIAAVAESLPGEDGTGPTLTLEELAARTGVSPALLEVIEREGLLSPRRVDGEARYPAADVEVVTAGLELLGAGLPLSELLALAREHNEAMRGIASRAVDMFLSFVRDPIRGTAGSDEEAAVKLVEAFRKMMPATRSLVTNHFERVLLEEAQARIEAEGFDIVLDEPDEQEGRA